MTFAGVQGGVVRTDPADLPDWRDAIAANEAGEQGSSIPVLVLQGTKDVLVRPAVAQLYTERACAVGTPVDLREVAGADHNGVVGAGRDDALSWTADRLSGAPASDTC